MFDRRLLSFAGHARRIAAAGAALQWLGLLCGVFVTVAASRLIERLANGKLDTRMLIITLSLCLAAAFMRILFTALSAKVTVAASSGVKKRLRAALFVKLTELGPSYSESASTAEIVQTASEGVDQLETYFSKYLPQFIFSVIAPVTLAAILAPLYLPAALTLLLCAPLIPLLLFGVSKMAGRVVRRQWSSYTSLGDRFLENLQGMTTLKVYGADALKQDEMSREAELFRQSTMRVLRMQLGSIIFMDVIAFGGAAAGVLLAARAYTQGAVGLGGALTIALLSAEFFIPLRQLGSLFHVSMSGAAASRRAFAILDEPCEPDGDKELPNGELSVAVEDLTFAYNAERETLSGVTLTIPPGGLVSLAGVSGSGKSTIAALLSGTRRDYRGSIKLGGVELRDLKRESVLKRVTLVPHDSYVFAGTVADNLRIGKPDATDAELATALQTARLNELAPGAPVSERGTNLSGGQRQRLCLARALLKDSDMYIFDEAASNIDVESEAAIMEAIHTLAETKTVLLISHRLANLVPSEQIYLLENGRITESGSHAELLELGGVYSKLFAGQRALEQYRSEVSA